MTRKPQPLTLALLLPLLAFVAVALAACGGHTYHQVAAAPAIASVAYNDNLRDDALCVDENYVRVPYNRCSTVGADGFLGGYGWVHHPYAASTDYLDVAYDGYQVDRHYYSLNRPVNVRTYYIDRGRFPDYPPPGVRASSVHVPTIAYVNRTKSNPAFAPNVVPANKPLPPAAKIGPAPNPAIQRGGLGVTGSGAAPPAPPAATPAAPKYAPRSSGGSSSSSGGWGGSKPSSSSSTSKKVGK